jgi:hypothetical protein
MPRGNRGPASGYGWMPGRGLGFGGWRGGRAGRLSRSGPGFGGPSAGRGSWGGRGHRNWFRATGLTGWQRAAASVPYFGRRSGFEPDGDNELDALRSWAEHHETALAEIRARIRELEARSAHSRTDPF